MYAKLCWNMTSAGIAISNIWRINPPIGESAAVMTAQDSLLQLAIDASAATFGFKPKGILLPRVAYDADSHYALWDQQYPAMPLTFSDWELIKFKGVLIRSRDQLKAPARSMIVWDARQNNKVLAIDPATTIDEQKAYMQMTSSSTPTSIALIEDTNGLLHDDMRYGGYFWNGYLFDYLAIMGARKASYKSSSVDELCPTFIPKSFKFVGTTKFLLGLDAVSSAGVGVLSNDAMGPISVMPPTNVPVDCTTLGLAQQSQSFLAP